MFIRRITYKLAPEYDTAEGQKRFEAALKAHTSQVVGLISSAHVPQGDGRWLVAAVYHTEADARAGWPTVQQAWTENRHFLAEPEVVEHFGLEPQETAGS